MKKMRNVLGLAALAALVAMPGMVNAAPAACPVTDMEGLKAKAADKENCGSIALSGDALTINESVIIELPVTASADVTVTGNANVTVNGEITITGADLIVNSGAKLTVNSKLSTGITASNVKLAKGTLTASADNGTAAAKNTAEAIKANVTLTSGVLTVNEGKITGNVTTAGDKDNSTINAKDIAGNVTVTNSSKLTADNITGTVVASKNASVVVSNKIDGAVTANDNATVDAKTITTSATVNGESASIKYLDGAASRTVTKGVIKVKTTNAYGEEVNAVYASRISSVKLASNEQLIIDGNVVIPRGFTVNAASGASIQNTDSVPYTIVVNGKSLEIKANTTEDVTNGVDEPADEANKPADETINKNPQTSDSIYSVASLALVGVSALGVAAKKRFN